MYWGLTSPPGSVTRRAWLMTPWPPWETGSPSSGRARPARIDSPAASAEVSPSVRKVSVFMFQTVSWAACHRPSVCGSSTPFVFGNSFVSEGRVTP